jgi:hypothetical protein
LYTEQVFIELGCSVNYEGKNLRDNRRGGRFYGDKRGSMKFGGCDGGGEQERRKKGAVERKHCEEGEGD